MIVKIQNQTFYPHYTGAAYWEEEQTVLLADLHLGKVSHFRKYGSAVPLKTAQANIDRLQLVVNYFCPHKIILLGDLFHSDINHEWILFENWVASNSMEVHLVKGNHDILEPERYRELGMTVVNDLQINNILITHRPVKNHRQFNLCGHVHPAVRLTGPGRHHLKLPCFHQMPQQMIFPAFGEFTGSYTIKPQNGDSVYALVEQKVIKVF